MPGRSELVGHARTMLHIKSSKTVEENSPMTLYASVRDPSIVKAELNVEALIARKNIKIFWIFLLKLYME